MQKGGDWEPDEKRKICIVTSGGNLLLWGTLNPSLQFPTNMSIQRAGNKRIYQFHYLPSLQSLSILFSKPFIMNPDQHMSQPLMVPTGAINSGVYIKVKAPDR